MLSQLLEIEEIEDLDPSNFYNICDLLTGLPEQVKFAVEVIKDKILYRLKTNYQSFLNSILTKLQSNFKGILTMKRYSILFVYLHNLK
ncbi:hypothetical protein EAO28_11635 [Klebsiella pneumoniae]|uniref:Uncharacterized protein n=1 Tax=Klebsiella pneumoniae TaxID=573 RepID=A0A3P2EGG0_KLEPN|nr:hypothetical protein EAO28_11635 [Klebsiella pneumoniae]